MFAYIRLFFAAIAAEVLLSLLIGLGVFYGSAVFPLLLESSEAEGITVSGSSMSSTVTETAQFAFTLPMGMPALQDLKMPLTYLNAGELQFGLLAVILSVAALVIQSFARAVYLGGLRSKLLDHQDPDLLRCGKHFFTRMLGWNLLQWSGIGLVFFGGQMFLPIGLLFMLILLFYAFTPYVIVILDVRVWEALAIAPGLFRRTFRSLLPLALLAMLCTFLCSFIKLASRPYEFGLALLLYIPVGTYLIRELMSRLAVQLRKELSPIPVLHMATSSSRGRFSAAAWVMLFLTVPIAGTAVASGYVYVPLAIGSDSTTMTGTRFWTGFGHAFSRSAYQYSTYGWQDVDANRIRLSLPDLAGGKAPQELRGMADVTWVLREERYIPFTAGVSTVETVHRDKLLYRLGKVVTDSGAVYYSSRAGSANLVNLQDRQRGPHAVEMMVSGDGRNVFVLVYPSRFRSLIRDVWRVSEDGRYLVPKTSQMNPDEYLYYWFRTEPSEAEDVFGMLEAKNRQTLLSGVSEPQDLLSTAMVETDGQMVAQLLDMLDRGEAKVKVKVTKPDWDAARWTSELRARYDGAAYQDVLSRLSRTGDGHDMTESYEETDDGSRLRYRVTFPVGDDIVIEVKRGEDHRLLELMIDPNGEPAE